MDSITKAAVALYTSQPSISNAIKDLEQELGAKLLIRNIRRIELTDAGRLLFHHCQIIWHTLDDFQEGFEALKNNKTGVVRMGSVFTIGAYFWADIISDFRKIYPNISIKFTENGSDLLQKGLSDGQQDVVVLHTPIEESLFHHFVFLKGDLQLLVSKHHPLVNSKTVTWQELRNEAFILFPEGFKIRSLIIEQCHHHAFSPKIICETTDWDFILSMVEKGEGITILPKYEQQPFNTGNRSISSIPFEIPTEWQLGVAWRKNGYLSFATKTWIQFLQKKLKTL